MILLVMLISVLSLGFAWYLARWVLAADEGTRAHIPERARGMLGPIDETQARALRARLLQRLNR